MKISRICKHSSYQRLINSCKIVGNNVEKWYNAEKSTLTPLHIKHCYSHVYFKNIGIESFFS